MLTALDSHIMSFKEKKVFSTLSFLNNHLKDVEVLLITPSLNTFTNLILCTTMIMKCCRYLYPFVLYEYAIPML